MNIIVLKFGGTSVADNEKLNIVSNKITALRDANYDVVVVVSAQGKKTDKLLSEAYEITKIPNNRELDVLLSTGEQASIAKLSMLLNNKGYDAVSLTGWQAGIYTNNVNQNAIIEHIDTTRIKKELDSGKVVIVAGFQGINENGDITTLGRGGSDTTAVSIAAALDAKECYIYSDVEGVYTSDPKKVSNPQKLNNVSYDEMLDISNEGAKVLHNRCIEVAKKYNIPIVAKSTFSNDKGTNVNNKIESQKVKSLVKNDELISVCIKNKNVEILNIYNLLINNEIIPVEFINNGIELSILVKANDYTKLEFILSDYELSTKKITRISIVGYGIANDSTILKDVMSCLESVGDCIQKIDINNGKIRITFDIVISNEVLELLHSKLI